MQNFRMDKKYVKKFVNEPFCNDSKSVRHQQKKRGNLKLDMFIPPYPNPRMTVDKLRELDKKSFAIDFMKSDVNNFSKSEKVLVMPSKAAVEFTKEKIAEKVDATGLSTKNLNAINTSMFSAMKKYNLEKIPEFAPTDNELAIIGVDRKSGKFLFNAEKWNEIVENPRQAFREFAKNQEKKYGRRRFSFDSPQQVVKHMIDHEVAHMLYNQSRLEDKDTRLWWLWEQHKNDEVFGSYATKESRDFFAEAFAIRERGGILSADIMDFIGEVIK